MSYIWSMVKKVFKFTVFFIQLAYVNAQEYSSILPSDASQSGDSKVALVLMVSPDFDYNSLSRLDTKVGSRVGDIMTLRVSESDLDALKSIEGIDYCQVANRIQPNLQKVIPDIRADSVYQGFAMESGYTGKDVIIGVTDWGFDYTHPMFYDTAMEQTRILAAWDQFKSSGPHPDGFDYGTEYKGTDELLAAEKDTVNIYGYATHGSHVAGIAAGGGAGTVHRGVAYESDLLFTTFLADEAAVIDAFVWMQNKAIEYNKRLVINMSWGLYNLGPLDGTSLVSQVIDRMSSEGVVFVTSGGNNGDVEFHIKREFAGDTMRSRVDFYPFSAHPDMWGQSLSMWGEEGESFGAGFEVYSKEGELIHISPFYQTSDGSKYVESFILVGTDSVLYNIEIDQNHPLNNVPHIRLRIQNKNTNLRIALKSFAESGVVHFYNVTELTTDVGNWGMPFVAWKNGWIAGDKKYSLGEPASTRSVITVAAHQSEVFTSSGVMGGGFIAPFSSYGPTIDGRMKPDVSAPGVQVASSVSSFTDRNYNLLLNVNFRGKNYPFSRFSGTSMSGPAIAGVVALILQANPYLSANDIKTILHNTAREDIRTGDLSESGDVRWGWGKVNAYGAVLQAEEIFSNARNANVRDIRIYPNPAKTFVKLSIPVIQHIGIYNTLGQQMVDTYSDDEGLISLPELVPGLYILKSEQGNFKALQFLIE